MAICENTDQAHVEGLEPQVCLDLYRGMVRFTWFFGGAGSKCWPTLG